MKDVEIVLLIFMSLIIAVILATAIWGLVIYFKQKRYEKLHPIYFENLKKHNETMSKSCDFYNKNILPLKNKIKTFQEDKIYCIKDKLAGKESELEEIKKELEVLEQEYSKLENEIDTYYSLMKQEIESDKKFKNFMVKNDFWREEE